MRSPLKTLCLIAMLIATGPVRPLYAELVLDDFDDPAMTVSPAMRNEFVDTPNVGELDVRRSIRIAARSAQPEGRLDVDADGSSAFIASIGDLNPTNTVLSKIVAVQSNYDLSTPSSPFIGKDISDAGHNNAIVFDFRELTSAVAPDFFNVIVEDPIRSYDIPLIVPPLSDQPFSIFVPFDSFHVRGGEAGQPDFSSIRSIYMELRVLTGIGPADLEFAVALDRIRFTRIPEPASGGLVVVALAISSRICRTARRRSLYKELAYEEPLSLCSGRCGNGASF